MLLNLSNINFTLPHHGFQYNIYLLNPNKNFALSYIVNKKLSQKLSPSDILNQTPFFCNNDWQFSV